LERKQAAEEKRRIEEEKAKVCGKDSCESVYVYFAPRWVLAKPRDCDAGREKQRKLIISEPTY